MSGDQLPTAQMVRVHAVNLAIAYYRDLAKTRLTLPKREDVDLAVEIKPDPHELLTTAEQIEWFILDARIPEPASDESGETA